MWPRTARSHLRFEMRARFSVKYMSFRTEIAWEKDSQRFQNRSTLSERHIERTPHPNVFTRTWPIFAYLSSPDVVPQAPLLSPHSRRRCSRRQSSPCRTPTISTATLSPRTCEPFFTIVRNSSSPPSASHTSQPPNHPRCVAPAHRPVSSAPCPLVLLPNSSS